jgi:predicted RNA binding protein with dsRBD fold (UPF0201 family)
MKFECVGEEDCKSSEELRSFLNEKSILDNVASTILNSVLGKKFMRL